MSVQNFLSVPVNSWNWKGGLLVAVVALILASRRPPPPPPAVQLELPLSETPAAVPYRDHLPFACFLGHNGETPE